VATGSPKSNDGCRKGTPASARAKRICSARPLEGNKVVKNHINIVGFFGAHVSNDVSCIEVAHS
jgi:hypothetical protein